MTGIEVIVLIVAIVVASTVIGFYMNHGQPSLNDMEQDVDNVDTPQPSEPTVEVTTPTSKKKKKYYPKKNKA